MPILCLDRRFDLVEDGDQAAVICEPKAGVSNGWCAWIAPDPDNPLGLWRRDYLDGALEQPWGESQAPVRVYRRLDPGTYEAHSTYRSRRAISVYFEVTASNGIAILGKSGDEDAVIARLNGMTPDELRAANAVARGKGGLPTLAGTVKQVSRAEWIRDIMIRFADEYGYGDVAVRLREICDSTWFIAHQYTSPADLRDLSGRGG